MSDKYNIQNLGARIRECVEKAGEKGVTVSEVGQMLPDVPYPLIRDSFRSNVSQGFLRESGAARRSIRNPRFHSNVYVAGRTLVRAVSDTTERSVIRQTHLEPKLKAAKAHKRKLTPKKNKLSVPGLAEAREIAQAWNTLRKYGIISDA